MAWQNGKNTWLEGLNGADPVSGYSAIDVAGAQGSLNSAIQSGELTDTKDGIINPSGTFAAKWFSLDNEFLDTGFSLSNIWNRIKTAIFAVAKLFHIDDFMAKMMGRPTRPTGTSFNPETDTPKELMDLSLNDQRYQTCLGVAHSLRDNPDYSLKGLDPRKPDDYAKIVERERLISDVLVGEIHKQKLYGDYNVEVAQGLATGNKQAGGLSDSSMHNDVMREMGASQDVRDGREVKDMPRLSNFASGELICRHYAPLGANLFAEAGMPNFMVSGNARFFEVENGSVQDNPGGGHAYVVSRLTGNVIETTNGNSPYKIQANNISMQQFLHGATIIAGDNAHLNSYGTGYRIGYDRNLAQKTYDTHMKNTDNAVKMFKDSVANGKTEEVRKLCASYNFNNEDLGNALNTALSRSDLDTCKVLVSRGALEGFRKGSNEDRQQTLDAIKSNLFGFFKHSSDPVFIKDIATRLGISGDIIQKEQQNGLASATGVDKGLDNKTLQAAQQHGAALALASAVMASPAAAPFAYNYITLNIGPDKNEPPVPGKH